MYVIGRESTHEMVYASVLCVECVPSGTVVLLESHLLCARVTGLRRRLPFELDGNGVVYVDIQGWGSHDRFLIPLVDLYDPT